MQSRIQFFSTSVIILACIQKFSCQTVISQHIPPSNENGVSSRAGSGSIAAAHILNRVMMKRKLKRSFLSDNDAIKHVAVGEESVSVRNLQADTPTDPDTADDATAEEGADGEGADGEGADGESGDVTTSLRPAETDYINQLTKHCSSDNVYLTGRPTSLYMKMGRFIGYPLKLIAVRKAGDFPDQLTIQATNWPWISSKFRTEITRMTSLIIYFSIAGFFLIILILALVSRMFLKCIGNLCCICNRRRDKPESRKGVYVMIAAATFTVILSTLCCVLAFFIQAHEPAAICSMWHQVYGSLFLGSNATITDWDTTADEAISVLVEAKADIATVIPTAIREANEGLDRLEKDLLVTGGRFTGLPALQTFNDESPVEHLPMNICHSCQRFEDNPVSATAADAIALPKSLTDGVEEVESIFAQAKESPCYRHSPEIVNKSIYPLLAITKHGEALTAYFLDLTIFAVLLPSLAILLWLTVLIMTLVLLPYKDNQTDAYMKKRKLCLVILRYAFAIVAVVVAGAGYYLIWESQFIPQTCAALRNRGFSVNRKGLDLGENANKLLADLTTEKNDSIKKFHKTDVQVAAIQDAFQPNLTHLNFVDDQLSRQFMIFGKMLYGSAHEGADIEIGESTYLKELAAGLNSAANTALQKMNFNEVRSSEDTPPANSYVPSDSLEAVQAAFKQEWGVSGKFYSLTSQLAELNTKIDEFGCKDTHLCAKSGCCLHVAKTTQCIEIDGDHCIISGPQPFAGNQFRFDLTETLLDSRNINTSRKFGPLAACMLSKLFTTAADARAAIYSQAVMIVHSITAMSLSYHYFNANLLCQITPDKNSASTNFVPTYSSWSKFSEHVQTSWTKYANQEVASLKYDEFVTILSDASDTFLDPLADECKALMASKDDNDYNCDVLGTHTLFVGIIWVILQFVLIAPVLALPKYFCVVLNQPLPSSTTWGDRKIYANPDAFMKFCKEGDDESIKKCFMFQDCPSLEDELGNRGLHWAAYYGHPKTCELLITNGCDTAICNRHGYNPMEVAASAGFADVVTVMRKLGAEIISVDPLGDTPMHAAARDGDVKMMAALLTSKPEALCTQITNVDNETPEEVAEKFGHHQLAQSIKDFYSRWEKK